MEQKLVVFYLPNKNEVLLRNLIRINFHAAENRVCGVVFATDEDQGRNGEISYELSGSDSFAVDSNSGAISTTSALTSFTSHKFQVN